MRSPVAMPLAKAEKTELAAGEFTGDGLRTFTKAEFTALGISQEVFFSTAVLNAANELRTVRYRFERDRKQVIAYAAMESTEPIVASAVLAPGFLNLWQQTLGDTVLVVVPNRFTAYVFPRLASDYLEYSPMVFRAYRDTAWPVSVEVFEVSTDGWLCIGAYTEP